MIHGRILVDAERCKGCELCGPVCPQGVIHLADTFNSSGYHPARLVDPKGACTGCAVCALVCPEGAITVYRQARPAVAHSVLSSRAGIAVAERETP